MLSMRHLYIVIVYIYTSPLASDGFKQEMSIFSHISIIEVMRCISLRNILYVHNNTRLSHHYHYKRDFNVYNMISHANICCFQYERTITVFMLCTDISYLNAGYIYKHTVD